MYRSDAAPRHRRGVCRYMAGTQKRARLYLPAEIPESRDELTQGRLFLGLGGFSRLVAMGNLPDV